MHLGIDVREVCGGRKTGKGAWTFGLVTELLKREVTMTLFTDADIPKEWEELVARSRSRVVQLSDRGLRWHLRVARMLPQSGIDLYLSPVSYIVPALAGKRFRCVPVVHDMIAFRSERHDRKAVLIEKLTLPRALRHARCVITTSESTKRDVLARFSSFDASRLCPVYAGPSFRMEAQTRSDGQTIVCLSTLSPRKNQLRLIQAFAALPSPLREQSKLVLIGNRGWADEEIVERARSTPGVEWKGYLTDAECEAVLQRAAIFAFPSLYEGFGLPLLDAMQRGIPILTSDRGSLQEVTGDAALYVDPENVASITTGLTRLLTDEALRADLVKKGQERKDVFSWGRTADLLLEALTKT